MGLTTLVQGAGTQNIDYQDTPECLYFRCGDSRKNAIGELPAWMNTYHFSSFWCFEPLYLLLVVASGSS